MRDVILIIFALLKHTYTLNVFFLLIFRYIRAEHYRYRFTKINSKEAKAGKWWKRTKIGNYLPPISLESVKHFMKQMDYTLPRIRKMRKH